jgi:signal transduction histidine kinase
LILNLVGNALDAAGPGGTVKIRETMHLKDAVLEVSDNGPGPPEAIRDRLFETFVTGKPDGVGLGLATARTTAEAHGGAVRWERSDGWTRFFVRLPIASGREE